MEGIVIMIKGANLDEEVQNRVNELVAELMALEQVEAIDTIDSLGGGMKNPKP